MLPYASQAVSSKHRGRKNASIYRRHLRGLSNHKVFLVTATDENDNILFKIAGLGQEGYDKYDQFRNHFVKHSTIISDDKPCIQAYLDWLVFRKILRYTLDIRKWKMRHIWRR